MGSQKSEDYLYVSESLNTSGEQKLKGSSRHSRRRARLRELKSSQAEGHGEYQKKQLESILSEAKRCLSESKQELSEYVDTIIEGNLFRT